MQTALVLILLLNGVQIGLPRPAVVMQGSAWLPLRPVIERMGGTVNPSSDGHNLILSAHGSRITLSNITNPQTAKGAVVYRHEGTAYIQARTLAELLGGKVHFDDATSTLHLSLPWLGETVKITRSELLANPLKYQGRQVTIPGAVLPASVGNSLTNYPFPMGELTTGPSSIPYSLQISKFNTPKTNEITGIVNIQANCTPYLTGVTARMPGYAPFFDRATAQPGERVILWLPEALGEPTAAYAAQNLEIIAPSGESIAVTSLELEKTREFTESISPQGWKAWYWTLPAQTVGSNGAVWRIRCHLESNKEWMEGSIQIHSGLESVDK